MSKVKKKETISKSKILEKAIEQEDDDSLLEALKDLKGFMFGW